MINSQEKKVLQAVRDKEIMDPQQDEELKKLSSRTEELLTRLNELSSNLNSQLKSQPPQAPKPVVPNPPINQPVTNADGILPPVKAPDGANYYSMPINAQYLEKHEKRIKTTGIGPGFLTSTSIVTEQHHFQGSLPSNDLNNQETFIPANFPQASESPMFGNVNPIKPESNFVPRQEAAYSQPAQAEAQPQYNPNYVAENAAPTHSFQNPNFPLQNQAERTEERQSSRFLKSTQTFEQPHFTRPSESILKGERFKASQPAPENKPQDDSLQPAAIFSYDQEKTKRAAQPRSKRTTEQAIYATDNTFDSNSRANELANQIAAKNKEIKDRLHKYSSRVQVSSQVDNLKLFAWLVLIFSPIVPITLIKDDFLLAFACSTLALFFGIFFCMMALRLVEVSELVRWAHNQILTIQSNADEQKSKN